MPGQATDERSRPPEPLFHLPPESMFHFLRIPCSTSSGIPRRVWRRISKPATGIVRGWWRPSSAPRMTGPASRRPTSCGSARRPVAGARTATTRGLVRSSRYICMSWSRTGGGGWGWRGVDAAPALAPADGLDSGAWTVNEFGGAPLGDQRLSARLVKSAGLLASLPGEAITANASHDRAAVKGYYRLIDQPVSSAVTPGNILAPHRARTLQRMRGQDTVLWCARLTGEGQPVEVRRKEGVTNHFRPESCAGRCEAAGEALTGARTGRAIEHRKRERLERRDCHSGRRQHRHHRNGEGMAGSCARLTGEG